MFNVYVYRVNGLRFAVLRFTVYGCRVMGCSHEVRAPARGVEVLGSGLRLRVDSVGLRLSRFIILVISIRWLARVSTV